MQYELHGVLLLALALIFGCSAADSNDKSDPGVDAGADSGMVELNFAPDERVGDLTDAEIDAICDPVTREVDYQCGTQPNGDPQIILETSGKRDCIAAIQRSREGEEFCQLAKDVYECWRKDPCERIFGEGCELECPERESCWSYTIEECETVGADWCYVMSGQPWNSELECYEGQQDAYCAPPVTCNSVTTTTIDDGGNCWAMNSECEVPNGWVNEFGTGEQTCPEPRDASCE